MKTAAFVVLAVLGAGCSDGLARFIPWEPAGTKARFCGTRVEDMWTGPKFAHFDGTSWKELDSGLHDEFNFSMASAGEGAVWVASDGLFRVHADGTREDFSALFAGTVAQVYAHGDAVFATRRRNDGADLFVFDGTAFVPMASPGVGEGLYVRAKDDVWGILALPITAEREVWTDLPSAKVHWDGTRWSHLEGDRHTVVAGTWRPGGTPIADPLSFAGTSPRWPANDIWIPGWRFDGALFLPLTLPAGSQLFLGSRPGIIYRGSTKGSATGLTVCDQGGGNCEGVDTATTTDVTYVRADWDGTAWVDARPVAAAKGCAGARCAVTGEGRQALAGELDDGTNLFASMTDEGPGIWVLEP